eukprot:c4245_g1_i1.p1 GENE.c4245_g1_i1~~c4245_g1_i1.p1  ORF type:complete len:273 (-),score=86.94 c4245_g1_i1:203-1021(-)
MTRFTCSVGHGQVQCVELAALRIATKCCEDSSRVPCFGDYASACIAYSAIDRNQVLMLESVVLERLWFKVNMPTSLHFALAWCKANLNNRNTPRNNPNVHNCAGNHECNATPTLAEHQQHHQQVADNLESSRCVFVSLVSYLLELCLADVRMSMHFAPSMLAATAVALTCRILEFLRIAPAINLNIDFHDVLRGWKWSRHTPHDLNLNLNLNLNLEVECDVGLEGQCAVGMRECAWRASVEPAHRTQPITRKYKRSHHNNVASLVAKFFCVS